MASRRICFQCHGAVPIENDAGELRYKVFGDPNGLQCGSRTSHLLPVVIKGKNGAEVVACKGFPYTAQYLEGQPRDGPAYLYFGFLEVRIRNAYQQLQDIAKKNVDKNNPSSEKS